ncbi:leucocin a translocator [Paucilactobacillus hokkaidonensis]|uniref:Leucocin a translocator n=1 Tax=Paucilactobacillus hokkaidonensis TaxID=1193095 RepID=A0ABR5Q755_9LACO|nr:leucocin a translocator [Paucilactobacillus hokkaidonensis]
MPQVDERDCGVAALDMVLEAYHSDYSLASLRELAKTDMEGTTALGIVRAAEQIGFETQVVKADMSLFDLDDIPYPFIAHVIKPGGLLHYYTIFSKTSKCVILGDPDPSVGLIRMSKKQFQGEWDGVAIFLAPLPEYHPKKESKRNLFALIPLLLKQRLLVTQIILASLLVTLISIVGSYYLQGIIDTYIPGGLKNTLVIISIGIITAYVIQQFLSFAENYLLMVMGQRLSIDIILGYIRHIFELPMKFFGTRRTGEIVSRFTDASQIIDALASTIISLFLDVGIVVIVGIVLAFQNINLMLLTLISIPLYAIIIFVFVGSFDKLNNDRMESNAVLSSSIIEDIDGIETIKSLNSEQTTYRKIDREFVDYLKKSFKYEKLSITQEALKEGLQLVLNVFVLWFGSTMVIDGKMTLGQLVTFNALLSYFTTPLQSIIGLQTKLQAAKVANNRLNEVYSVDSEFTKVSAFNEKPKSLTNSEITLTNVKFRYGFGNYALDDISLTIKAGAKIALVGASGSGKSTLVKLLVRFFESESGQIRFGQIPLNEINQKKLRATINYLPQEPYIFSGTIYENLLLGCSDKNVGIQTINNALEIAAIKDDIEAMQLGLETPLSADGSGISGGQKQRIAIARAVLADTPVMIMDESTSNLDLITERKIIGNLLAFTNKTIIFVAHRLTIAEMVDDIYVMNHGKVIEHGSHEKLRNAGGFYSKLLND